MQAALADPHPNGTNGDHQILNRSAHEIQSADTAEVAEASPNKILAKSSSTSRDLKGLRKK